MNVGKRGRLGKVLGLRETGISVSISMARWPNQAGTNHAGTAGIRGVAEAGSGPVRFPAFPSACGQAQRGFGLG